MKIINLSEGNSLLNQYVAELRDVHVQNDRMRFRRNIERIGEIMAYEMSKALTYSVKQVQTPLGTATASTHDDKIVIATVFRAGLPLHTGFLNMFDHADNAFVSAFRFYKDDEHRIVDVHIEYIAAPSLNDRTLLLVDPMLATGNSAADATEKLKAGGARRIGLIGVGLHLQAVVAGFAAGQLPAQYRDALFMFGQLLLFGVQVAIEDLGFAADIE